jgi:hypothetical protein
MAQWTKPELVIEQDISKPTLSSRQEGSPSCSLIPSSPTNGVSLAVQPGFAGFVRTQDITFTIPTILPGGCQLEARFPAGYAISSSGNAQVNVIAKGGNAPGAIVGTTTFTSDPYQARKIFINSFACEAEMEYTLGLAGAEGTVDFSGSDEAGLFMAVGNCW